MCLIIFLPSSSVNHHVALTPGDIQNSSGGVMQTVRLVSHSSASPGGMQNAFKLPRSVYAYVAQNYFCGFINAQTNSISLCLTEISLCLTHGISMNRKIILFIKMYQEKSHCK